MTSEEAYRKAKSIYPQRNKKLEAIIVTNAWWSYMYANVVLKGRFKEGEKAIATDAYSSYFYAKYVINGRFKEGEKVIFNSEYFKGYFDFLSDKEKVELLTDYPHLINNLI